MALRYFPLAVILQATVRISEPPSVENQLQTQRLARGEMLAIVATASGVPQPQYQWRRNGVPIPGATRPMLVRHSVTEADMGTYTCDVSVPWLYTCHHDASSSNVTTDQSASGWHLCIYTLLYALFCFSILPNKDGARRTLEFHRRP